MSAPSVDVIRWGREKARTGPWRGDGLTAYLAPVPNAPPPSAEFLRRCLATLASRGYLQVVTAALSPPEQDGFLAAGFSVREELRLLAMDLSADLAPAPRALPMVRGAWRRREQVLAIDEVAFAPFWRFDHAGLVEALHATPSTRLRLAVPPQRPRPPAVAYAICGRAGSRGFVQRLAVDPSVQRHGIGRSLLTDGLRWMRSGGASAAVVNTQQGNDAALALYLGMGFRPQPDGLSVLAAGLT